MDLSVKIGRSEEENEVFGAIIAAFLADPLARWLLPEPHQYLATMPEFIKGFGGAAFANESAYYIGEYSGAALWLPPGIHFDEDALVALVKRDLRKDKVENAFALFEQMGKHHPDEPHWYLPLIGVDPVYHARGYGSALMKHALQRCDNEGKVAYLESSNPRNISLYIRYGFEITGLIRVADSPPLIPMLREPKESR
jgi:ribosomal protein S18 acetylase RimI-like enzyme